MRVLSILPYSIPSTVINVDIPLQELAQQREIEYLSRLEYNVTPNEVAWADTIVLCRNTEPRYRPIFDLAIQLGIPMIYVLDDNIKGAPPQSASYHYHQEPTRLAHYEWLLGQVDLIRVHSPALIELIAPYNPRIILAWAAVDWSLAPAELSPLLPPYKIVYAAQQETGQQLFNLMRDDLHQLLARYPSKIELHFLGYRPSGFDKYPHVVMKSNQADYKQFFRQFTHAGYAIGLAPMLNTPFFRCKTDVKYRDYAAAGAVGIYMKSDLYNTSVTDQQTGLLINGQPGSWLGAIEALLESPDLLNHIRQQARQAVFQKYHLQTVGPLWLADFAKLPRRPTLNWQQQALIAQTQWSFPDPNQTLPLRSLRLLRSILPDAVWQLIKKGAKRI